MWLLEYTRSSRPFDLQFVHARPSDDSSLRLAILLEGFSEGIVDGEFVRGPLPLQTLSSGMLLFLTNHCAAVCQRSALRQASFTCSRCPDLARPGLQRCGPRLSWKARRWRERRDCGVGKVSSHQDHQTTSRGKRRPLGLITSA